MIPTAEQRIHTRVARAEGVTGLTRGSAATPAHAEEWMRRHAVRIGRATPYGSALGRGARVGAFGGLAILDAFSMYRDQKMSQYVMAPYVLEDENGSFTLQQQGLIWRSYSKRYISGSLEGQSVSIGSREFGELRDEAEALWGRVNFWGDWEPGLLRRELPVEDPNGCEEAWGVGGPCA